MKKSDKYITSLLFGFIILIIPFCISWWSCYLLSLNIFIGMIVGLIFGIVINIIFLFKVVNMSFNINYLALGIIAGWYIGRRMKINNYNFKIFKRVTNKVNLFCLINLIFICIISAIIALSDKYTTSNIEGMLNLSFHITNSVLLCIIIIDGILLISMQFLSTKFMAIASYKR